LSAYADTSFIGSLYLQDANSTKITRMMQGAALPLLLTPLTEVELTNALFLQIFRKTLTAPQIYAAEALFREDLANGVFEMRPLSLAIFDKARLLSRKQTPRMGTRALDVLHVASALVLQAGTLYTFDRNQRKLAEAEGLKVISN
jgi:predicted nucleic acid-binding protein